VVGFHCGDYEPVAAREALTAPPYMVEVSTGRGSNVAIMNRIHLCASLVVLMLAGPQLSAGLTERIQKKQEAAFDHWKRWLEEDVVYVTSEEEVFKQLTTEEEREQFVEQFWRRRDPDPSTPENEFRVEHYRRVRYANDMFAAGIHGWKTDRGMVYIKFGAPNRIESHPIGRRATTKLFSGSGT